MKEYTIAKNPPNINHLSPIAEKYILDLDNYPDDIDDIYESFVTGFQNIVRASQQSGALKKIFPKKELFTQFTSDFLQTTRLSLGTAWSLGRNFAETNPQKAKHCISIRDYNSDVLPDDIRTNIKNLGDNAAYLDLLFLQQLYDYNFVQLSEAISISDNRKRMYREGALHLFIRGIIRFYKKNQIL